MVDYTDAYSGFSVDDIDAARVFYGEVLGFPVEAGPMSGVLHMTLPSGQGVFIYGKPTHAPATFTILNLVVDDIERAVDELNAAGVVTKIYEGPDEYGTESYGTDARGISRSDEGPAIAWFRDPAGNVLSVVTG